MTPAAVDDMTIEVERIENEELLFERIERSKNTEIVDQVEIGLGRRAGRIVARRPRAEVLVGIPIGHVDREKAQWRSGSLGFDRGALEQPKEREPDRTCS